MPVQPTPIYASIETRHSHEGSLVVLSIFDKKILLQKFSGDDHRERAKILVLEWNGHLDKEWQIVRETSACIMETFAQALTDLCVSDDTIEAAIDRVNRYAAK